MGFLNRKCKAYEAFARYIGKDVVIFYNDVGSEVRKLFGRIVAIEANVIHLDNPASGWRGCINCETCRIGQISTLEGWGNRLETTNGIR